MTRATIHDFTPGNIVGILDRSCWAILSADVASGPAGAPFRRNVLRFALDLRELEHYEVVGKYEGADERSVLVLGIQHFEARELGRLFSQETVLVPEGLLDVAKGTVTRSVRVLERAEAFRQPNHSSILRTGAIFSIVFEQAAASASIEQLFGRAA